jgi:hypothetical protein
MVSDDDFSSAAEKAVKIACIMEAAQEMGLEVTLS